LYAGLGSSVTRTVFLRRAESLVLRVQARTPNDAEGFYRIRFGSTFVPAVASTTETPEPPDGVTGESVTAATAPQQTRRGGLNRARERARPARLDQRAGL
ncbi:MAG TPA: hypothetical protein VD966_09970, partial [Pyrinomonadaceae bacterium]|nr:hypothetical protein [Pyrinomonadaceae bacterium]